MPKNQDPHNDIGVFVKASDVELYYFKNRISKVIKMNDNVINPQKC
jgi:hypothetical protein